LAGNLYVPSLLRQPDFAVSGVDTFMQFAPQTRAGDEASVFQTDGREFESKRIAG
jgi:hypothetical protein